MRLLCGVCGQIAVFFCPCHDTEKCYCSPDCQRYDWIKGHKYSCGARADCDVYGVYFNFNTGDVRPVGQFRVDAATATFSEGKDETRFAITVGRTSADKAIDPRLIQTTVTGCGLLYDIAGLYLAGEGIIHRARKQAFDPGDRSAVLLYLNMITKGYLDEAIKLVRNNRNTFFQMF